jgi:hypothetical protein
MGLESDSMHALRFTDARQQCTHQLDLAALAVAAAARGTNTRRYDVVVPDQNGGDRHALLARDGIPMLDWVLDGYAIAGPQPFAGQSLAEGFTRWVTQNLNEEAAEAALVLRRGVFISGGRALGYDWNAVRTASPTGKCWVQQAERAERAFREIGAKRDFSGRTELLTQADNAWLAFGSAATELAR